MLFLTQLIATQDIGEGLRNNINSFADSGGDAVAGRSHSSSTNHGAGSHLSNATGSATTHDATNLNSSSYSQNPHAMAPPPSQTTGTHPVDAVNAPGASGVHAGPTSQKTMASDNHSSVDSGAHSSAAPSLPPRSRANDSAHDPRWATATSGGSGVHPDAQRVGQQLEKGVHAAGHHVEEWKAKHQHHS